MANVGGLGAVGRQWFLRSSLITTLPDEVINKTVLEFSNTPIGCSECRSYSQCSRSSRDRMLTSAVDV